MVSVSYYMCIYIYVIYQIHMYSLSKHLTYYN